MFYHVYVWLVIGQNNDDTVRLFIIISILLAQNKENSCDWLNRLFVFILMAACFCVQSTCACTRSILHANVSLKFKSASSKKTSHLHANFHSSNPHGFVTNLPGATIQIFRQKTVQLSVLWWVRVYEMNNININSEFLITSFMSWKF